MKKKFITDKFATLQTDVENAVLFLEFPDGTIKWGLLEMGTQNRVAWSSKKVNAAVAMFPGATSVFLVHNHPRGTKSPSKADLNFKQVYKSKLKGFALGFGIVADGCYVPF